MKKIVNKFFVVGIFILFCIFSLGPIVNAAEIEENVVDKQYIEGEQDNSSVENFINNSTSSNLTSSSSSSSNSGSDGETWYNIGTNLPHSVDYGNGDLLKYLKKGDIVYEGSGGFGITGHIAIVEGIFYDEIYEQYYVRLIEAVDVGVTRGLMTPDRFSNKEVEIYRLTDATDEIIDNAVDFMISQLGKKYQVAVWKNPSNDNNNWYCSELLWAAFYWEGIYLDEDDNDPKGSIVYPKEIISYENANLLMHYQYNTTSIPISSTSHQIICNGIINYDNHHYLPYSGYTEKCYVCDLLSSEYLKEYNFNNLFCHSKPITRQSYVNCGEFLLYEIEIVCAKNYTFDISSASNLSINLYNINQEDVNPNITIDDELTVSISKYLSVGTYYLRIYLEDINKSDNVTIVGKPTWRFTTETNIGNNDISGHLHKHTNGSLQNVLYHINTSGPSFYKFSIEATKADGSVVTYPYTSLKIYDHMDEFDEDKYSVDGYSELAQSIDNNNYLYMYLERNGYYYIHVNMPDASYISVKLNIERVNVEEIEVVSRFDEAFTETLINSNDMTEYATGFSIDQTSVFTIDVTTSQTYTGNITFILFRKAYNNDTKEYYIDEVVGDYIPLESDELRKILVEGTYYIGFFGNTSNVPVTIKINRIVTTSEITDQVLVMDIDENLPYGTEVRHNDGEYGGKTITEGFTRHIHFQNVTGVPSVSRYDYSFYSSNKNYATVSEFGTVFAKSVTGNKTVTITAVYKYDPAIIFTIELTIIDDTSNTEKVIETTQTISLSEFENGKYKLVLDENNSPYPWIQYYNWSVFVPCQADDIAVTIDNYGFLTTSGVGTATLTGTYSINPNVTVIIHINFVE